MKKNLSFFIRNSFYVLLLILISCSKESIDDYENPNDNDSGYNLIWQSNTTYETTIQVGETITWTWGGGTHNLRSTGGTESFDSGYSSTYGFTFSHTFTEIGVTTYVCDPHDDHMYGTVIVTE